MPFGPDANQGIDLTQCVAVDIKVPAGKQIIVSSSCNAAAESAFLAYRQNGPGPYDLHLQHEGGTPPYRNWNDRQWLISDRYIMSAWAKVHYWYRNHMTGNLEKDTSKPAVWLQSKVRQANADPGGIYKFECDDKGNMLCLPEGLDGHDWDWNDVVIRLKVVDLP